MPEEELASIEDRGETDGDIALPRLHALDSAAAAERNDPCGVTLAILS